MPSMRLFREAPIFFRAADIVHPWVYPWFFIAALAIGAPGTVQRPTESLLPLALGASIIISVMFVQWLMIARRPCRKHQTTFVLSLVVGASIAAGLVTQQLILSASYGVEPWTVGEASEADNALALPLSTQVFLTTSLILVWLMLWLLTATLVSGQRSYRKQRRALLVTLRRIERLDSRFRASVQLPARELATRLASDLRIQAREIAEAASGKLSLRRASLLKLLRNARDEFASPALQKTMSLRFDEENSVDPIGRLSPRNRVPLEGIPFRWKGRYFSGFAGGLVIGVIALSAGVSAEFSNPGFLLQIPLIVLAFSVSVAASLILFLAAALTPFLGPNSAAPENYALFAVIAVLAFLSFLHRANEVRQTRILEGLSVANADLALGMVRLHQQTTDLKKKLVSIIHGEFQSSLVAAILSVQSKRKTIREDARLAETILNAAADDIERSLQATTETVTPDFASAISQIVDLWGGEIRVNVSVTSQADEVLAVDRSARAAVIEIVSEATLNAAKHSMTDRVDATVTVAGTSLRIAVTNRQNRESSEEDRSTQVGLAFLRQITTEIRLEVNENTTTLVAEVPFHIRMTEGL